MSTPTRVAATLPQEGQSSSNAPARPENPLRTSAAVAVAFAALKGFLEPTSARLHIAPTNIATEAQRQDRATQLQASLNAWIEDPEAGGNKVEAAKRILKAFQENSRYLDLNHLGLTLLPIGSLTELRGLSCAWNELKELPPALEGLTQLQELDCACNQLTELPPGIGRLIQLQELNCACNQLKELPPALGRLTQLQKLDCSENKLTELTPAIGCLTQLQKLNCSNNLLTELRAAAIGSLTQLQKLDCSNNQITQLPAAMGDLPQLQELDFGGNPVEDLPMALSHATALTSIHNCPHRLLERAHMILETCRANRAKEAPNKLPATLTLWLSYAKAKPGTTIKGLKTWSNEQKILIQEWLVRLARTSDFRGRQQALAEVVCSMLQEVTQNESFAAAFFAQVSANNNACGDRAAMALNELYVHWRLICDKGLTREQQIRLVQQAGKTFALRAQIAIHVNRQELCKYQAMIQKECVSRNLPSLDSLPKEERDLIQSTAKAMATVKESVEIYLYYETALRKRLDLLTFIQSTIYADTTGPRDWIPVEQLVADVESSYLNQAVALQAFETLLAKESPQDMTAIAMLEKEAQKTLTTLTENFDALKSAIQEKLKNQELTTEQKTALENELSEAKNKQHIEVDAIHRQLAAAQNEVKKRWFTQQLRSLAPA